jgi:hypothetical protein
MDTKILKHVPVGGPLSAGALRHLVDAFAHMHVFPGIEGDEAAIEREITKVRDYVEHHVGDAVWRERLLQAYEAAKAGRHEYLVLRFSSRACIDGGRAIRARSADWPAMLIGEAAEVYRVGQAELLPRGYRMTARALDGPHDRPGEFGLFLSWARHA